MEEIARAARVLAETLRASALYRDYRAARIRLAENPDVAARLLAYKKKWAAMETKRLSGAAVAFEEEKEVSHLYATLTQNELAARFLACEDVFLTAYRQALDAVNGAVEIDVML